MNQAQQPSLPPIRAHLLAGALLFVQAADGLPGVARIALLGSLATAKADPRDIDLLVTVADGADLGRKLKGHAQGRNCGADSFLASPRGAYLGRTCHWKVCQPGVRMSCVALHCCDLLIAHQDELEAELAALQAQHVPELVGNAYLVIGTLDRAVWKRGKAEPLAIPEMVKQLHDFVRVMKIERSGLWSGGAHGA